MEVPSSGGGSSTEVDEASIERPGCAGWLWNLALYPLGFAVLAVALVELGRAFPGVDDSTGFEVSPSAVSYWLGMVLYWAPGVALALGICAVLSWLPHTRARELVKSVTPLVAVGGWIVFIFAAGMESIYFTADRGEGVSIVGWSATAATLLVVGHLTMIRRRVV